MNTIEAVRMSDVEPQRLCWLWPGRFPAGKLSLLCGDPSLGKSLITVDMAARVSAGTPWPDRQSEPNPPGGVVLLSAEDDPSDTICPRLMAAGADLARVTLIQAVRDAEGGRRGFTLNDVAALDAAIEALADVRLVIVDPISAYLAGTDSHKNAEVRSLLAPLAAMAQRHAVAVVAVQHLTKSMGGKAMFRAMGSLAFIAAARAAWAAIADPGDPRHRGLLPIKMNLHAELQGLGYQITTVNVRSDLDPQPIVAWDAAALDGATADEWLAAEAAKVNGGGKRGPEAEALEAAKEFLKTALAGGPRKAKDLYDEGMNGYGYSQRTLVRARIESGVVAYRMKVPGPWYWRLPPGPQECQVTPQTQETWHSWHSCEIDSKTRFSGGAESQECQECQVSPVVDEPGILDPGGNGDGRGDGPPAAEPDGGDDEVESWTA